jgi:hypothetical protein
VKKAGLEIGFSWEIKDPETGKVLRKGKKKIAIFKGELLTLNFIRLFTSLFSASIFTITRIDGSTANMGLQGYTNTPSNYSAPYLAVIALGDSDTDPSRSDYRLKGTEIASANATIQLNETQGFTLVSASFSWTTDKVVKEAGLYWGLGSSKNILIDRQVWTGGLTVPANKVLTVAWRFAY